ncbi:RTA1-domain-containing protein [Penicillium expansum]|nr:RTA1-domain-containing protein [Penicillium expansum]
MARLESYHGSFIWNYLPSFVAGIVFASLFAICSVINCWRVTREYRKLCCWFILGGFFETAGFAIRAVAHHRSGEIWPYVVQTLLILLAPALFAASVYATLGRTISNLKATSLSALHPRWMTIIFVSGDILSFFIQAVAGSMLSSTKSKQSTKDTGKVVMILGLVIQVIFLSGFFVAIAIFHQRWHRMFASKDLSEHNRRSMRILYSLYGMSGLILVRSVFRVIEYIEGNDGYLLTHEWPLYVFDGTPMILVMAVFIGNLDDMSTHSAQSMQCLNGTC